MSWVRLDDGFGRHHKVAGISDKAFRLHVCALCESAAQLLDGRIPKGLLSTLPNGHNKAAVKELVAAGLWAPESDGFVIHDYLDWNPSSAEVRAKRDQAKERMQRARAPDVRANRTRTDPEQPSEQPQNEPGTSQRVRSAFAPPVSDPRSEIRSGRQDPRPDTLRAPDAAEPQPAAPPASPEPEPGPERVPCPPDLALSESEVDQLEQAAVPRDLVPLVTAELRSRWVGDGSRRTVPEWRRYLRKAVANELSDGANRRRYRARLRADDASPAEPKLLDAAEFLRRAEAL